MRFHESTACVVKPFDGAVLSRAWIVNEGIL
jgi:hypothetical protein